MKIAAIWAIAVIASAAAPERSMTVCIKTLNHTVFSAESMVSKRFAEVGIRLEWRDLSKCGDGLLVVAFSPGMPASADAGALGYADYEQGDIVISYDRIARRLPGKESVLLAHVLAHEITHVLIGASYHSETGLMKAHWEARDLSAMLFKPLPFTPGDVGLLQRGLDKYTHEWLF
jgi:hypothetical protein